MRVGRLSLVGLPLITGPWIEPTSSTTEVMTGAAGAVASTFTVKPAVGRLTLPTASVAVTVRVCRPSASGVVGVKLQALLASATTLPSSRVPS